MKYEKFMEKQVKKMAAAKNTREVEALLKELEDFAKANGFSASYARQRALKKMKGEKQGHRL